MQALYLADEGIASLSHREGRATLKTTSTPCEVLLESRQRLGSLRRATKFLDNHANACRKLLLGVKSFAMYLQEVLARHGR